MTFSAPADHGVEVRESEKVDKYMDLARELKKLWIYRGNGVVGNQGTVPKGQEKRLGWRNSTLNQLEYFEDLTRLAVAKTSVKTGVKNMKKQNNKKRKWHINYYRTLTYRRIT